MKQLRRPKKESTVRVLTVLLFVAFFTTTFTVGSEIEIPQEEQEILKNQIKEKLETARDNSDSSFIFLNNVFIGLMMVIPFGIGIVIGLASAFVTGLTVGGFDLEIPAYLLLYTTPFGFIELIAYSLAMTSSLYLTKSILKKNKQVIKKELKFYGATVGIVVALIFFGGVIENHMLGIGV